MPPFIPRQPVSSNNLFTLKSLQSKYRRSQLDNLIDANTDRSLTDIGSDSEYEDLHISKRRKFYGDDDADTDSSLTDLGSEPESESENGHISKRCRSSRDMDSDSSLTDLGSESESKHSRNSKRCRLELNWEDGTNVQPANNSCEPSDDDDSDGDEEVDWEDAIHFRSACHFGEPSGALELTLDRGAQLRPTTNRENKSNSHSKIERQIRVSAHCMHVQLLLFHNLIRNGWICDKEVQQSLIGQLPAGVKGEIERWRKASWINTEQESQSSRAVEEGSKDAAKERNHREWGGSAMIMESDTPNLSRGDPLIRLLKVLTAYWKKKFTITAPGLRKQGYKSLPRLEDEIKSFKRNVNNSDLYGERLENVQDFRGCAKSCEGSRDVGAQLFTALVRGLGIEARLVASLQPIGFGWGKGEEAAVSKKTEVDRPGVNGDGGPYHSEIEVTRKPLQSTKRKNTPLDSVENEKSRNFYSSDGDAGDGLRVDANPSGSAKNNKNRFDQDILFPTYWTEVISPIQYEIYSVDSLVLNPPVVATSREHLGLFEPRGHQAAKAKQVIAYVASFSSDGTAKDVTCRYLRHQIWPGRTKGVRLPVEKVPIHNSSGKVIYYEDYDWFQTVMSSYKRTSSMRGVLDDVEEARDLKPLKREKDTKTQMPKTLQGYKISADFVLERHLRREEVILPGSKPVKTFLTGKGDQSKEEPVFNRRDVVACRTGESWHKAGRQIKDGEQPMKMVPVRAMTLNRKREVEEAEINHGEKLKRGMYSWDQTDLIIPPPIENGVIPKNSYGNMDCFVQSMVPQGAVHIRLNSTSKICRKIGIDFAEACTGFEFGKQRAVPVITGVVVAAEHKNLVIEEWKKEEEERMRKEDLKREKAALSAWKKLLVGLRIVKRVREEYGGEDTEGHSGDEIKIYEKNKCTSLQEQDRRERTKGDLDHNEKEVTGGFAGISADGVDEFITEGGFLRDENSSSDLEEGFGMESEDTGRTTSWTLPSVRLQHESHVVSHSREDVLASGRSTDSRRTPSSSEKEVEHGGRRKDYVLESPPSGPRRSARNRSQGKLPAAKSIAEYYLDLDPLLFPMEQSTVPNNDATPKRKRGAKKRTEETVGTSSYFSRDRQKGADPDVVMENSEPRR